MQATLSRYFYRYQKLSSDFQVCSILRMFPRHALHKKGYRNEKGVDPPVGSQEKSASCPIDKPVINDGSNADFVPRRFS